MRRIARPTWPSLCLLLGGLVGFEREIADEPSGLRTHMLVAATADLLVGIGNALLQSFHTDEGIVPDADPMRIVQALVNN